MDNKGDFIAGLLAGALLGAVIGDLVCAEKRQGDTGGYRKEGR